MLHTRTHFTANLRAGATLTASLPTVQRGHTPRHAHAVPPTTNGRPEDDLRPGGKEAADYCPHAAATQGPPHQPRSAATRRYQGPGRAPHKELTHRNNHHRETRQDRRTPEAVLTCSYGTGAGCWRLGPAQHRLFSPPPAQLRAGPLPRPAPSNAPRCRQPCLIARLRRRSLPRHGQSRLRANPPAGGSRWGGAAGAVSPAQPALRPHRPISPLRPSALGRFPCSVLRRGSSRAGQFRAATAGDTVRRVFPAGLPPSSHSRPRPTVQGGYSAGTASSGPINVSVPARVYAYPPGCTVRRFRRGLPVQR